MSDDIFDSIIHDLNAGKQPISPIVTESGAHANDQGVRTVTEGFSYETFSRQDGLCIRTSEVHKKQSDE